MIQLFCIRQIRTNKWANTAASICSEAIPRVRCCLSIWKSIALVARGPVSCPSSLLCRHERCGSDSDSQRLDSTNAPWHIVCDFPAAAAVAAASEYLPSVLTTVLAFPFDNNDYRTRTRNTNTACLHLVLRCSVLILPAASKLTISRHLDILYQIHK